MNNFFMTLDQVALSMALTANIFFGLSCLIFAKFTDLVGANWVNLFKAIVATLCFLIFSWITVGYHTFFYHESRIILLFSGLFGLALADIFLLTSLKHNGVGETLIFFSFQPFFIYLASHFLWGDMLHSSQWVGVFIFCLCLIIFCIDKYKKSKLQVKYAFFAFVAIIFDTCGVIMTKMAYKMDPMLRAETANVYRGIGAVVSLMIICKIKKIPILRIWNSLESKKKSLITFGSFTGTFLSLTLYLNAVKIGNLTLISAVAVATPLWATFFEFFYLKKRPTKVFVICFFLYCFAFLWNFFHQN